MNINKPPDETLMQGRNRLWLLEKFLDIYHVIGSNSSKMAITLEERSNGTYPVGVFIYLTKVSLLLKARTQGRVISWICSLVSKQNFIFIVLF
jgi:hypothetical protein